MFIKIKQKQWMQKRIESGVTWTGAIKLGLFNPTLKKSFNKKVVVPKSNFYKLNSKKIKRGQ